ncbi:PIN domain nuclease [Thermoproteus tenax]|uniref:PIN domain nuclease n=1 Tax=Thermoproteus tenax TaxID=2271 RepID=UPI001E3E7454|nr:PIN domain nuclease [Thermoproteus tenax]
MTDTSSLVYLVERRLGLGPLEEHVVFVPYPVLEELLALAPFRRNFRVALRLVRVLGPFVAEGRGSADEALLSAAAKLGAAVLTGDRQIVAEAKRRGIPVALLHDREIVVV